MFFFLSAHAAAARPRQRAGPAATGGASAAAAGAVTGTGTRSGTAAAHVTAAAGARAGERGGGGGAGQDGAGDGGSGDGAVAPAGPLMAGGRAASRYAGAMLLHAFGDRAGAGEILSAAAGGEPGDVALLSVVSMCFALGAATLEQFKHLTAAAAGPLAGLAVLPDLRTIRPKLAAIADGAEPGRAAAPVRGRDAGRRPGGLRGVLRR